MIIDLTNIEATSFLSHEGTYTLKVIKVDESQTTANGNPVIKVTMQTKDGEIYTEDFVVTDNALWRLKLFTKALKMPNVVDTRQMVGRYVIGEFKHEDYVKKDGTQTKILKAVKWHPSKYTNTLEAPPQAGGQAQYRQPPAQQQYQQPQPEPQTNQQATLPEVDIDDDSIPF